MDALKTKRRIVKAVAGLVRGRQDAILRDRRRAVVATIHTRQYGRAETELGDVVTAVLRRHIRAAAAGLRATAPRAAMPDGRKDAAETLADSVCDLRAWTRELVDAVLPVLARVMADAAVTQWATMGRRVGARGLRAFKTTATEWLADEGIDTPPWLSFDIPRWMQEGIEIGLREAFAQDYWDRIAGTTKDDIETIIRGAMLEGESVATIAGKLERLFPDDYSYNRGLRVARTETGNALNAARDLSIRKLKEDLGEAGATIGKSWVSILGNTTRDSHAALDGVIADAEGLWDLGGVRIPWPAHYSLPPGERCNCRCTVITEYGLQPEDYGQQMADLGEE